MRVAELLGRLAAAVRPKRPWLTVTAPPWLARILIAGGARKAPSADAMTVTFNEGTASLDDSLVAPLSTTARYAAIEEWLRGWLADELALSGTARSLVDNAPAGQQLSELGFDSLHMVALGQKIREKWGIDVPLAMLPSASIGDAAEAIWQSLNRQGVVHRNLPRNDDRQARDAFSILATEDTEAAAGDQVIIVGGYRSGKSTLLQYLITRSTEAGRSVLIVDPAGQLTRSAIDPKARTDLFVAHDTETRVWSLASDGAEVQSLLDHEKLVSAEQLLVPSAGARARLSILSFAAESPHDAAGTQLLTKLKNFLAESDFDGRTFIATLLIIVDNFAGETALEPEMLVDIATLGRDRGVRVLIATDAPGTLSKDLAQHTHKYVIGLLNSPRQMDAARQIVRPVGVDLPDLGMLTARDFYIVDMNEGLAERAQLPPLPTEQGPSDQPVEIAEKSQG